MMTRILPLAFLAFFFAPTPAHANHGGSYGCMLIHVGLISLVFGLVSGYHSRKAGNSLFRVLFMANAGLYAYFILSLLNGVPYGGPICSGFEWLIFTMPALAVIQAVVLIAASRRDKKERPFEYDAPPHPGIASTGILLGLLTIIVIELNNPVATRWHDRDNKADLVNYFLACKSHWADEGGNSACSLQAAQMTYGFFQSPEMQIVSEGDEKTFTAVAYHPRSRLVYRIDATGDIEPTEDHPFPPPAQLKTWGEHLLDKMGAFMSGVF